MIHCLKFVINFLYFEEYLELLKYYPFLIYFHSKKKELEYNHKINLYQINDDLPSNMIYKENLYFFIKLMKPIYFYLENFSIIDSSENSLTIMCKNKDYLNYFYRLNEIMDQSFRKRRYIFDTGVIIDDDKIIININLKHFQELNLDYSKNKFLIKYLGVNLHGYTRMCNNFQLLQLY